ncbi:hypothetical protein B6D60_08215 [candidate division KSB1 bacterium 4484_87]|nr:MAG: hypothetical protein B6D60_08215 [candidate division KSB1 bacterium 4484_87]
MSEIEKQEIVDMFVQSALRCAEFYDLLSSHIPHEQLKKIFSDLSFDGKKLSKELKSWSELPMHVAPRQYFDINRSKYYFDSLSQKSLQTDVKVMEEILPELSDIASALQIAISFEKDGILFWEEMKSLSEGELSKFITDLISQRKQRVSMLLKMKGELVQG